MVNPDPDETQTSQTPAYALARIRELADAGKVQYGSRTVENDIVHNLCMGLDEVCRCLASLEPSHFAHSKLYPGKKKWMDVYLRPWATSNDVHDLYIKLMLTNNVMTVTLCSFHWER